MNAAEALAELHELSSQVEEVAVLGAGDGIETATNDATSSRLAEVAKELLAIATSVRGEGTPVSRVEVAFPRASVFVVRESGRTAVAVTVPDPTAGLVLYDLRTCLRRIDPPPKARGRRPRKTTDA